MRTHRSALPLLPLLLVLALPAGARAGTVRLELISGDSEGGTPPAAAPRFDARPGEANDLTVTLTGKVFTVTDAGAPLTVGSGCVAAGASSATCTVPGDREATLATLDLGDGDDRARGPVQGSGGDGNDVIDAAGTPFQADEIDGGRGNDTLTTSASGAQQVLGGSGDDTIAGDGLLSGGYGNDTIDGGPAGDSLFGGAGADVIHGGAGDDSLNGDSDAAPAPDVLDGGPGQDTVDYAEAPGGVTVDLEHPDAGAPGEHDRLSGIENIKGSAHSDVLRGDDGANEIFGATTGPYDGGDRIAGRGGADRILGTFGEPDVIFGNGGADDIDAGAGDHVTCDTGLDTANVESPLISGTPALVGRSCEKLDATPSAELSYRILLPGAHGAKVTSFARRLGGGCGGLVTLRGADHGARVGALLGQVTFFWPKGGGPGQGLPLRFKMTGAGRTAARHHARVVMRALSGGSCARLKKRQGIVTRWRARL